MNVVQLESTIEYLEFGGTLYKDLPDNEKILCVISDFFLATKGNYFIKNILTFIINYVNLFSSIYKNKLMEYNKYE